MTPSAVSMQFALHGRRYFDSPAGSDHCLICQASHQSCIAIRKPLPHDPAAAPQGVFPDLMSGSKQHPPKRLQGRLECLGHSIIERLAKVIHIENLELPEKSLATGKGVVLLLARRAKSGVLALSLTTNLEPPDWLPGQTRIARAKQGTPPLEGIRTLDQSEALSYDFILTAEPSHPLLSAARQLAIPVISLP